MARMKPRQRPPTKWLAHSVEKIMRASRVGKAAAIKIAASNWWHKMSGATRKAAFDKHEPGGAHGPSRREVRAKAGRGEKARERARRLARSLPRRADGKFLPMRAMKSWRREQYYAQDRHLQPGGRASRGYARRDAELRAAARRKSKAKNYCSKCRGPHVRGHRR